MNPSFQITTHRDAMEPYTLLPNLYRLAQGMWVDFSRPSDIDRLKWHGYVREVEGTYALVIDDCTFTEVHHWTYPTVG